MNAEATEVQNSPRTVSEMMSDMLRIREERRQLAVREKELVAEWEVIEGQLLAKLAEQGSVRVSSKEGTASVSEQELPLIEDWDAYYQYIKDNDAFHLLQRRPAVNAFRELVEAARAALAPGEELPEIIPGTRMIVKKSINLRAGT